MSTLYLCGAGNPEGVRLALRVQAAEGGWDRIVLLDDDPGQQGREILGVEVAGPFELLSAADPATDRVANLVARTTRGRAAAGRRIAGFGIPFASLVAPGVDRLGATLPQDVIVYPGATLGPESELGPGSVVFMGAVVGHGSRVGAGCVLASNAVINARAVLEDRVYLGTNATVLPELTIGEGATVAAGSVAMTSVRPGATVMGVPARPLVPEEESPGEAGPEIGSTARSAAEIEEILAGAWTEVLDGVRPDPDRRIMDLGVDSLAVITVAQLLRERTGLDVNVVDLFRFPTIRSFARHRAGSSPPAAPPPPRPRAGGTARAPGPGPSAPADPPEADAQLEADALTTKVVEAFAEVLGVPDVTPDSHFFDLGGDPTSAHAVARRLQGVSDDGLCFMQILHYPTPRELAGYLSASAGSPPSCLAQGVLHRMVLRQAAHRH